MEFFLDYLSFFLKAGTITAAILAVVMVTIATSVKRQHRDTFGHLEVRHINELYEHMESTLKHASLTPAEAKKARKAKKPKKPKKETKVAKEQSADEVSTSDTSDDGSESSTDESKEKEDNDKRSLYVLDFEGDLEASRTANLKHEISAVLTRAKKQDEVIVRVESAGGMVHSYGYAASQLLRVKNAGVALTVAVDKVAASGGYMLAVVADKIIAAPFAVLGSIGVVAELPNLNRLLKKHDVDYEVFTAGQYKRTLSVFGENTDAARSKFKEEIEDTHGLFKEFVEEHRDNVDLEVVSTGESWYGERAVKINLVDVLQTSDEYIMNACKEAEVYGVSWVMPKKPLAEVIAGTAATIRRGWNRITGSIQ
ncbi:MAG: protease SohB [Gammaproteobacteria bacterium]|nr:protease SohB [Gammaproteobacteria bacterium]MYD79989.1 protease SohB [Gammaproteobacteria bacterium]